MRVFISWSGTRSKELAIALRDWLPTVLQAVKPYMSDKDLLAGTRWASDVAAHLDASDFGIICLTPENRNAAWINFESGALSKKVSSSRVVPYLLDLDPAEVDGPLSQFQAKKAERADTLQLLESLNVALGEKALEEKYLVKSFDRSWEELATSLAEIEKPRKKASEPPRRDQYEMLQEIIDILRAQERGQNALADDPSVWSSWNAYQRAKPFQFQDPFATALSKYFLREAGTGQIPRTIREAFETAHPELEPQEFGEDEAPPPTAAKLGGLKKLPTK